MPDDSNDPTCSPPQCGSTKSEAAAYSPLWSRKRAWLPWQTEGRGHGLKAYHVTGGGHIEEVADRERPQRKKIKGISLRQWEQRS